MLNYEQPEQQPAALVRVTPEELAAAIARLEARRAGTDGKIAIGDAVTELSLDATPEEVLAEVRAARASKPKRQLDRRSRPVIAALIFLSLLGGGTVYSFYGPPWGWASQIALRSQAVTPPPAPPQHISLNPNLLVGERDGKMVLLSEVGDNQPVYCSYSSSFQPYSPGNGIQWTLIKHGGKTYVRGWILKMSPAALAQDGADVSANGDPAYAVRITLPVRGFAVSNPDSDERTFHAQNIHLDGHASEKW